MYSLIKLHNIDIYITVDTEDFARVNLDLWCLGTKGTIESLDVNPISLPHYILGVKETNIIEYINGNNYDNRKSNLRPHSRNSFKVMYETKKVFEPHSLHMNSDKKCPCVKVVYLKYKHGFSEDVPYDFWTQQNIEALEMMVKKREVIPYDGVVKDEYDRLMAPIDEGASHR